MRIRAIYMKALINAQLDFEYLTEQEQIDMIEELIRDHNISYPNDKRIFMVVEESPEMDNSLDW